MSFVLLLVFRFVPVHVLLLLLSVHALPATLYLFGRTRAVKHRGGYTVVQRTPQHAALVRKIGRAGRFADGR
jgi:hypothetical protein